MPILKVRTVELHASGGALDTEAPRRGVSIDCPGRGPAAESALSRGSCVQAHGIRPARRDVSLSWCFHVVWATTRCWQSAALPCKTCRVRTLRRQATVRPPATPNDVRCPAVGRRRPLETFLLRAPCAKVKAHG